MINQEQCLVLIDLQHYLNNQKNKIVKELKLNKLDKFLLQKQQHIEKIIIKTLNMQNFLVQKKKRNDYKFTFY